MAPRDTARKVRLARLAYLAMACVALGWSAWTGRANPLVHPDPWLRLPPPARSLVAVGAGILVAALTIATTRVLVRHVAWARTLEREFRRVLGPLTAREILALAVYSAVGEELLFRGAMQPTLGLLGSSVVFGLVHVGPGARFLPWTVWAGLMGAVLGALYAATGELTAPIVAHAAINHENMRFILRRAPAGE